MFNKLYSTTMKRSILMSLLMTLTAAISTSAQAEESDTRPMFGLRAAFDVNIPGDWHNDSGSVKMYKTGYGATVGGVCNVYIGHGFYIEPGVSLFYDSYSYVDLTILGEESQIESPSLYKLGVRIPVLVGYSFNLGERLSMSVYTGPEVSYAFAGKIKENIIPDDPIELNLFDGHRRFDCAWKAGVGFPVKNFLISVDAAIGVSDLLKGSSFSFRENRVSIGLTYYL